MAVGKRPRSQKSQILSWVVCADVPCVSFMATMGAETAMRDGKVAGRYTKASIFWCSAQDILTKIVMAMSENIGWLPKKLSASLFP